jgi:hypothetical protein
MELMKLARERELTESVLENMIALKELLEPGFNRKEFAKG